MKIFSLFLIILFVCSVSAQSFNRNFGIKSNGFIEINNSYGRVFVRAEETESADKVFVQAEFQKSVVETDIKFDNSDGNLKIEVAPQDSLNRIDLTVKIPARTKIRIKTTDGEVRVSGNLQAAQIETDTGTISADVPLDDVRYDFVWTESRPRFLSDVKLEKVKEKAAGKFIISGKISRESRVESREPEEEAAETEKAANSKDKGQRTKDKGRIKLDLTTARGIILLNVNPNEVPSDLRERPLTDAAKAIIRSGDSLLVEAIRRASPKYFGDYAKTLPPFKREPVLGESKERPNTVNAQIKRVLVRVLDTNNRAVPDLTAKDFEVSEAGEKREILSVQPTTAPFNLVLLLDVSGSVDNYVDFIRKTARNFVNTISPNDKVAIVIFNEDVKTLSTFITDKGKLSESLDTFDAGGGTAYYDALAYTLAETLRPLKGERTAIVALTDGDDNRSFLPFDALLGSIQESGALVYPLYVPSGLIAAEKNADPNAAVDPLRMRYNGLSSKAEGEGEKLANISGGVYYSIQKLGDLQKAYDDIVTQLRTAYSITFRSNLAEKRDNRASPRLKVKVDRQNTFVKLGSVVEVKPRETSQNNGEFGNSYSPFTFHHSPLFTNISYQQSNEISGEVEKINYKQFAADNLRTYEFENFDVNNSAGAFLLEKEDEKIAVSRWISPKRTRSYPYERVYNTFSVSTRITVVPIVKDEGAAGDRDFLQWDTISLMSWFDVYVILAYYETAEKHRSRADKITNQKFNNEFVLNKIKEISHYHSSALHWNLKELKNIRQVLEKALESYREISARTQIKFHNEKGLTDFSALVAENLSAFMENSRLKAQSAQGREFLTVQPKEILATQTKAKVTITNYLGGKYFFTVDEILIKGENLFLIESKHSKSGKLPSVGDIKDGLLKMMLYTNLENVGINDILYKSFPVLRLTSGKIVGEISSITVQEKRKQFYRVNKFSKRQIELVQSLFVEAKENNFAVSLGKI